MNLTGIRFESFVSTKEQIVIRKYWRGWLIVNAVILLLFVLLIVLLRSIGG